ncbi:Rv1733c family protein [Mycobacterium palustre]|nr:hypothetical protein [Mycobacterium palustre]MCV7099032.1 hypothetical protein [Mycobacterium palustre]
MDTFTLDPRCWRIGHIFGRNPLIRRADRIEALVRLAALVVSLLAIPAAGVVAAAVYSASESRYAQEAHERHTVPATVIDKQIEGSSMTVGDVRWPVAAGLHTGPAELTAAVNVGDRVQIWVDGDGNQVEPPTPTWHAVCDASGAALAMLLCVGVGITSVLSGVLLRLDRARDADWEHQLRCLEEDGGRTNQH